MVKINKCLYKNTSLLLLNMSALKPQDPTALTTVGHLISLTPWMVGAKFFFLFFLRKRAFSILYLFAWIISNEGFSMYTDLLIWFCVCDSGCVSGLFGLCLWSPRRWFARMLWDSRSVLSEENRIIAAGCHSSGTLHGYEGKRTEAAPHAETYTHTWTHTDYRTHIHTSASFPQTHLPTTQHNCQCGSDFFVNKTTSWFRVL